MMRDPCSIEEIESEVVMANVVPDELDLVTIVMMPKLNAEEAARSTSNKRRRQSVGDVEILGLIQVKASRLRKCSTYFEACMSERWAELESAPKTFHLEAYTEVMYYEDCFDRMNFLCKPIASVKEGIELLKIASQIGFQAAVDIGVKYLAAVPWSNAEENMVRDFCSSPYVSHCTSLCDLKTRLEDLPPGAEDKQEKSSVAAMKLLSRLLRNAIPDGTKSFDNIQEDEEKFPEAKEKFSIAFRRIMWDAKLGAVLDHVVEFATALVTREALRLLEEIPGEDINAPSSAVLRFCWLFKVAQQSNVAQGMVELLVSDSHDELYPLLREVYSLLQTVYYDAGDIPAPLKLVQKWAWMVYTVFEDVMAGRLFLQTSQRVALFLHWRWFLCEKFVKRDKAHLAALVTRFVTTLPQWQQEDCWASICIDHEEGPSREAYAMWVSQMVIHKVKRPQQPDFPS